MKVSVLLNSRYQITPLYVSLLVYGNEYEDMRDIDYFQVLYAVETTVSSLRVSAIDSYSAYYFSEIELTACIRALRYCLKKNLIFLKQAATEELIEVLARKRSRLRETASDGEA